MDYDLYGPVRNAFDVGRYSTWEGKWEGVGPCKSRLFWPCEMESSRKASAIWGSAVITICARTVGSALISPSFGYLSLHVHNQTVGL